jgi:hypothetical protein
VRTPYLLALLLLATLPACGGAQKPQPSQPTVPTDTDTDSDTEEEDDDDF